MHKNTSGVNVFGHRGCSLEFFGSLCTSDVSLGVPEKKCNSPIVPGGKKIYLKK